MVSQNNRKQLFDLGLHVLSTSAALNVMEEAGLTPASLIDRHITGDFGDLCEEDRQLNHEAIKDGSRILSAYLVGDVKLYCITEAKDDNGKRSATTILLAEEY